MNFKVILVGVISLVGTGAIALLPQVSHANSIVKEFPGDLPKTILVAQNAVMSGEFVAAEAPTTGTAKIVEENGQQYLEIDSAFSTNDQAPDLQILLDTVAEAPATYGDAESTRYLNLGGIQSVTGEQRYPIPDFVDPSQFASVVVWCRMANATMGYAPLSGDVSASVK